MPVVLSNLLTPPSAGPLIIGVSPVHGSEYGTVQSANALLLLGTNTDKNAYIIGRDAATQIFLRPGNTSSSDFTIAPTFVQSSTNILLTQAAGNTNALAFLVGGSYRWTFTRSAGTEPGANVGSDFYFGRYSDAGTWIDNPITIGRATGNVILAQLLWASESTTARASIRIGHGVAPTSPVDGDMWTTSAGGLHTRVNGVTYPQAGVVIGGSKPTNPPVGTVWAPSGTTVPANSYAQNISSGTTVVVTHNLATTDVVVAIYRLSDGLEVDVPFSRTSTNAITLNSAIDLAGHRVVILAAGGSGILQARASAAVTTASLAASASEAGTINLANGYRLMRVTTNRPARVRLYTTAAKQTADASRAIGTAPTGDHGLILEAVTTSGVLSTDLSPMVDGFDGATTPTGAIPYHVTNKDSTTGTVTVTFLWIRTE
jgi:hypothetical protein